MPISPLNYHCVALAATTLAELADSQETRDDALRGLDEIDEAIAHGRGVVAHESGHDWASAIRDTVSRKKAQVLSGGSSTLIGLRHLADAAVGEGTAPRPESGAGPSQDSIVLAAKAAATAAQSLLQEKAGSEPAEGAAADHGYLNTLA